MTKREMIDKWGLQTAKAEWKAAEFIQQFGWTQEKDGLWLSPYKDNYLEGTRTSAIVAAHIERLQVESVQTAISEAAKKFE